MKNRKSFLFIDGIEICALKNQLWNFKKGTVPTLALVSAWTHNGCHYIYHYSYIEPHYLHAIHILTIEFIPSLNHSTELLFIWISWRRIMLHIHSIWWFNINMWTWQGNKSYQLQISSLCRPRLLTSFGLPLVSSWRRIVNHSLGKLFIL